MAVNPASTPANMALDAHTEPYININSDIHSSQPTIHVTKRHDRSTLMMLLQLLIKPFAAQLVSNDTVFPAGSPQLTPHKRATKRCRVQERMVEEIYLYDIVPTVGKEEKKGEKKKGEEKQEEEKQEEEEENEEEKKKEKEKKNQMNQKKRRVYYYSGGGWQSPANSEHWFFVSELAKQLHPHGYTVTLVSYPLAPNSAAPTSFPAIMRQYRALMELAEEEDEEVILAGDSAGGNIVLAVLIQALTEDERDGIERPTCTSVMAISPSTDLTRSNADMHSIAKKDPILRIPFVIDTAKKWCGEWSPQDVRVSPLYADLQCIRKRGVKVHGVVGRYDILSPDAILFREKCSQARIQGEWLDWDKQIHVFPLIFRYGLREGHAGKDWVLDVLRRT